LFPLVETIDLFPTLVDCCSVKDPSTRYPLDGKSLRPLLEAKTPTVREAALSYWGNRISIRTKTHRLIYSKGKTELYRMDSYFTMTQNEAGQNQETVNALKQYLPGGR